MDGYSQIIFVPKQMRKILLSIFIISILSFFIFWGANYTKINLASFFSIITARVTINPLETRVSAPAEVEINKVFKIEARITNKGEEKNENAKAEIFLPESLVLLRKDSVQEIGTISGEKEKKIYWSASGEKMGSYIVLVKASGELRGQIISAEDNALVEVKEIKKENGPRRRFQNFFDFFQKRLKL